MATKKKTVKRLRASKPRSAKKSVRKTASTNAIELKLPRVGSTWAGQAGRFVGIIRGDGDQPDYALVAPTHKSAVLKGIYGPYGSLKDAESELDGMANTGAMAKAGSTLAKQVLALRIEGHADFYIAARHEARMAYLNAPELYDKSRAHWTSTQCRADNDFAWAQDFDSGTQFSCHNDYELPVVVLHRQPIR